MLSFQFFPLHLGSQLLGQGVSALLKLAGVFLHHPEPVVASTTILLDTDTLQMRQPNQVLCSNKTVLCGLQICFYGMVETGHVKFCGSANRWVAALLKYKPRYVVIVQSNWQ
jgi:hypothetical protein